MIGWLQGQLQDPWQQANRCGLLLICQGVGYEVQVSQRLWASLPPLGDLLTLHVHQSVREDGWTLFGFETRQERDVFRELVAVNGVGPQMGLALLGAMGLEDLARAIVEGETRLLTQAPGVGKRTAERLSLELRQKFLDRFSGLASGAGLGCVSYGVADSMPSAAALKGDELQSTLMAMGYEGHEIHAALKAVAAQGLDPAADGERWLGDCLRWLSRSAA
ncbi:MAG: Holliday junction branch migration protein RuvA [Cyanobacteriota bacterium]|nr:Holliday junction branch migration protein RuvA [Cyanobacteriota bacterium]